MTAIEVIAITTLVLGISFIVGVLIFLIYLTTKKT